MKILLVAESRDGQLLNSYQELIHFGQTLGAETAMVLIGNESSLPAYDGTLYLGEVAQLGEFNPNTHKELILEVIGKEQPEMVVLPHSSYGWDLAPRLAIAMNAAQVSEVIGLKDGQPLVPACNAKLQRRVAPTTETCVLTLQAGAFTPEREPTGTPALVKLQTPVTQELEFLGYEAAQASGVDLSKAEVIVSAGRGIGKPDNLSLIEGLAKALKGEFGASRPVVDADWADHSRQVGTTGQTVNPKLYVACGISGAIQHLAGMKKSEYILAINTDREAPIGEVADVLAVADLKQLVPLLTERLAAC